MRRLRPSTKPLVAVSPKSEDAKRLLGALPNQTEAAAIVEFKLSEKRTVHSLQLYVGTCVKWIAPNLPTPLSFWSTTRTARSARSPATQDHFTNLPTVSTLAPSPSCASTTDHVSSHLPACAEGAIYATSCNSCRSAGRAPDGCRRPTPTTARLHTPITLYQHRKRDSNPEFPTNIPSRHSTMIEALYIEIILILQRMSCNTRELPLN